MAGTALCRESGREEAHAGRGPLALQRGSYRLRLARTAGDLDATLRLRYRVFNLELREGLAASHATGRDEDRFDRICDHLLVEERFTGEAVGTYRMQTAEMAAGGAGFYSAGEFDLSLLPRAVLEAAVEIGRACIAEPHRNLHVLLLLWQGLAAYVAAQRKRYLFGCCSLTGTDAGAGWAAYGHLERGGHLHPHLRVRPLPGLDCGAPPPEAAEAALPTLFRTYLRHGAKVCGPPAIDREFGTIDFLTLIDTDAMDPEVRRTFFRAQRAAATA